MRSLCSDVVTNQDDSNESQGAQDRMIEEFRDARERRLERRRHVWTGAEGTQERGTVVNAVEDPRAPDTKQTED